MKRICKRTLALLLAALIFCSGSIAAFAEPEAQEPEVRTQYGLESTDKVGALLGDAMTDSIPDDAAAYAVTDVTLDGKTATVSLNNSGDCTVVVALYTEDRGTMLGSGVQKAAANAVTVKVNIEIAAMPEYFLLKAFLLGGNNEALCPHYTDIEHTKGFETFDSKTVDDFKDDVVINFDDAKDENFAVLVDGAVQTKDEAHNVLQSYDEETGKYVFTNIDDTVRALSKGDIFKSETDDTMILLKVKSVSVDGSTATIYEEQDTTYADFFQFINVDESSYNTEEHATVNMDYADESVEFVGYSEWDDEPQVKSQSSEIEIDGSGKLCPEFKGTKNLIGNSGSTFSVVFTYGFKVSAEYELKMFYDVNWRLDFWNTTECLFCQLKLDFKIKGEIGLTGKFQFDLPLTELNYPTPVCIILTAKFDIHFEVTASLTLTIELFSFTIGFRYVEGVGFQNLCKAPQFKFEPKVEAKAEVKLAFVPIPCLSFVKTVAAEIQPEVGAKATLTLWTFDAMQALGYKMPDKLDTCTQPCFEGVASLYFSCKITGKFFGESFGDFPLVAEMTRKLGDFYVRFNPFSMHWGTCPNLARRVDFTVVNKNGKPIDNIDVESGAPDLGKVYSFNTKNATDTDGTVCFYYPKGTYTVKVMLDGAEAATKEIRMLEDTLSITIKVNTDKTDGGGSGHHDYNGTAPGYSDGVGSDDTPLPGTFEQGDYINFGSYPQTEVTNLITKEALNVILDEIEQNDPNVWKSYGYYTGTGTFADGQMQPQDYMVYTDVYYRGGKYRAVKFSQYRPWRTSGCMETDSSYNQDNGYDQLNYIYWFQFTPIHWEVLDPATGLLLCASILDAQAYNNFVLEAVDNNGNVIYYGDKNCTYRANDYAKTTLYHWLTNDFYATAFSAAQQKQLLATNRNNKCYDSSFTQYNSTPTTDSVFLLSYTDLINGSYGFSTESDRGSDTRNRYLTGYAKCQGAPGYWSNGQYRIGYWWLSSPDTCSERAYSVGKYIYYNYNHQGCALDAKNVDMLYGVCPAIRLKLNSGITKSAKRVSVQRTAETRSSVTVRQGTAYTASADGTVAKNEYVLLVRKAGTTALTPENLLYIDQQTAETNNVTFTYAPRAAGAATVEIIGDFGSGVETRTVGSIAAPSIGSVTIEDCTVQAKSTAQLAPSVQANGTDYTLVYSSSDAKVATVDANGKVTALKKGTATITVTATDEYGNQVSDTCTVTVKYAWWQWLIIILLFGWIWY